MGNTLLKITMPSTPSVSIAPFDAQTIGLTDWDNDITVGGLTYRATRFALGDATSSQDFSQGKGGLALGNQINYISLENGLDGGGLLSAYVASGEIPLNGAIAQLLDETGAATVQTWILCEMSVDGATLSFSLRTPGYMSTKLVRFPANRYDAVINVGVAVGDSAVNDLLSKKRYKGVSIPASGSLQFSDVKTKTGASWNRGNPDDVKDSLEERKLYASEIMSASDAYSLWPSSRKAFAFDFVSSEERDLFWNDRIGMTDSGWTTLEPNEVLVISNGSNSETILSRDSSGNVILGPYSAPSVGEQTNGLASRSVSRVAGGTTTVPTPTAVEPFAIDCATLIHKPYGSRTVGGKTVWSVFVSPNPVGDLNSITDAESVFVQYIRPNIPICAGADRLVGYSVDNAILSPRHSENVLRNVLYVSSFVISDSKIFASKDVGTLGKLALSDYFIISGAAFTHEFVGYMMDISNFQSASGYFTLKIFCDNSSGGSGTPRYLQWKWKTTLDSEKDYGFSPDYIFVDVHSKITLIHNKESTLNNVYLYANPMFPFGLPEDYRVALPTDATAGDLQETWDIPLIGPGIKIPSHSFASVDALNKTAATQIRVWAQASDAARNCIQEFCDIHLIGVKNIDIGSDPAVVIPGNFPGTSNPTTTPAMAATQLAAWLGLSPKLTGGITPSSGTWGEFIGASPDEDDATYGKQRLGDLLEEAWIYGQEANLIARAPDLEVPEYPVLPPPSVDDLITEPSWDYDYAGTSKQFTAAIKNVGESFDISKSDGYFWGGWQEKDTCHFSASPGSAVLAMSQLEDCLAVACVDGSLRCSYDGGVTWPLSQALYGLAATAGVALAGNGIMVAVQGVGGASSAVYSVDTGRTWATISTFAGATVLGGWFDPTTSRFWLCGQSGSTPTLWHSEDGIAWAAVSISSAGTGASVGSVCASGNDLVATVYSITGSAWGVWVSTDLGATWSQPSALPQAGTTQPFLGCWNSAFCVSVGVELYSSADLSTWTSAATPAALQAFATDGTVVVALAPGPADGIPWHRIGRNHVYYSRDQGATWRAVQISPEGATWVSTGALMAIWDSNSECFRLSGWGPRRIIALGDPSVLDIWHRCRASCVANSDTIATATYKTPGLYDSSELLRWLLDCKDGTDSEYQQPRIDWITKGARFVTLRGRYSSIVDQLSVAAGLPITIPRKILTYSGNAANIPTTGIVSKATHHLSGDDKGLSEIEIIMPPL